MRRRAFIAGVGGTVTSLWPLVGRGEQEHVRRIGALMVTAENDPEAQLRVETVRRGFKELGWIQGSNIQIDYRWTGGDTARANALAAELVGSIPDAIIANGTLSLIAVRRQTTKIPIVFITVGDPVGQGFVASLSHPGGNTTGFTSFQFEMSGKWLELLKEVAPQVTQVAIVFGEDAAPYAEKYVQSITAVAPSLDTKLIISPLRDVAHIESAVAALAGAPKSGLIVIPDAFTVANRGPIVALAARYQMPAIYAFRFIAVGGGLMSYGHDTNDLFRRATSYLDRILKGASPGDLPIQQPTKFALVINLKSAKALGLTVPPSLLARADEVIE